MAALATYDTVAVRLQLLLEGKWMVGFYSCDTVYWERPVLQVPEYCGSEHFVGLIYRHSVGLFGRWIDPSLGLYLYTGQHNTERRGQTSMGWVGFEPTVTVNNRHKASSSDRAATVNQVFIARLVNGDRIFVYITSQLIMFFCTYYCCWFYSFQKSFCYRVTQFRYLWNLQHLKHHMNTEFLSITQQRIN
jgi:hypothetical protein